MVKTYDEKLSQLEEENEIERQKMLQSHNNQENDIQKALVRLLSEREDFREKFEKGKLQEEKKTQEVQEKEQYISQIIKKVDYQANEIEILTKEKQQKEEQVREKEKTIHNLKYKISELGKAKHVLQFRTTEIRKSLEPKESQIEKLKEELFKLENEFEGMLKSQQIQGEQMKKLESEKNILTTNLNNQTE